MAYELELDKAVKYIIDTNSKKVCLQLPEGLKNQAVKITDYLTEKTSAEIIIWSGSCFGACDTPDYIERLGFDLLIQWGHSEWRI
jgi:2-(3-amino-3-carboxypropyl)histidine synthase